MAAERAGHTATLLNDGTVLVAGGSDFSGNILSACELFDATSMTFAGTAGLETPREANTATLLKDGTVLEETVEYPIGHRRRRQEGLPLLRQIMGGEPPALATVKEVEWGCHRTSSSVTYRPSTLL